MSSHAGVRVGAVLVSDGTLSLSLANVLIGCTQLLRTQRSVNLHMPEASILSNLFCFQVIFFRSNSCSGIQGNESPSQFLDKF